MDWNEHSLRQLRDKQEAWLMTQPGVRGSGLALDPKGRPTIVIYTDHIADDLRGKIRDRFGNAPVDFDETGEITASVE